MTPKEQQWHLNKKTHILTYYIIIYCHKNKEIMTHTHDHMNLTQLISYQQKTHIYIYIHTL